MNWRLTKQERGLFFCLLCSSAPVLSLSLYLSLFMDSIELCLFLQPWAFRGREYGWGRPKKSLNEDHEIQSCVSKLLISLYAIIAQNITSNIIACKESRGTSEWRLCSIYCLLPKVVHCTWIHWVHLQMFSRRLSYLVGVGENNWISDTPWFSLK